MKVDVLIEYNKKSSEVTFSSKATQFTQTRPARIGLSHPRFENRQPKIVEFVGEDWKTIKEIPNSFENDPNRKDWLLDIVNPFESATFEPYALFRIVDFLLTYIAAKFYPRTWSWRKSFSLIKCEVILKIPDYASFNPQKKSEFEELLNEQYKEVSIVS
jgi:hypothetical protein